MYTSVTYDRSKPHYIDGRNVRVGDRVERGPDWLYYHGDDDGGRGGQGTVTQLGFGVWRDLLVSVRGTLVERHFTTEQDLSMNMKYNW